MRTNSGLFVRIHARLHSDERGFSLLESVIAITIIFGSLITLAMSASSGFRYVAIGREEQAANQIANQLMEEVRGLAFTKVSQGLQTSDLGTDPNIVTGCGGDASGVYRLESCSGERIVSTNFDCPTRPTDCSVPLVPNNGTIGEADGYPVDYTWRSYVTNNCTSATGGCAEVDPYRVRIIVEWTGPGAGAAGLQRVTTESLFHSPRGCGSAQTHPFAAPCQPFFYGQALAPAGRMTVNGTVSGVDFSSGVITTTGVDSTMQVEQVSSVAGSWTQTGTELTTSAGVTLGGATTSRSTAADSDPSGTTPGYSATPSGALGTASNQFASGNGSFVQVQNPANDTGQAISATQAGGADVCPPSPPAPPVETDLQPCGGAMALQAAGTARVVGHFHGFASDLGDANLVSIGIPTAHTTAFSDRIPVTGVNGNVRSTATRTFGTVRIGGLPDLVLAPVGWLGFFVQLSGYTDTIQATAGTNAAAPTATIGGGTLSYWNGTGYSSVSLSSTPTYALSGLQLDHTTLTLDGHTVQIRIEALTLEMESVPAVSSTPSGSGSIVRNEAKGTIGSPVLGDFTYEIWVDGAQVVDLTITPSLGTLNAKSTYQPPPSAGS